MSMQAMKQGLLVSTLVRATALVLGGRAWAVLALFGLVWAAAPAQADTITFNDGTDSLSGTAVGSRAFNPSCFSAGENEGCLASIPAPAGTSSQIIFGHGNDIFLNSFSIFFGPGELIAEAADPDVNGFSVVSDILRIEPLGQEVGIGFYSDGGEAPLDIPTCRVSVGECFLENGQVQIGASIVWCSSSATDCIPPTPNSPGLNVLAVDTIQFCSDVEGVSSSCGSTSPGTRTLHLAAARIGYDWIYVLAEAISQSSALSGLRKPPKFSIPPTCNPVGDTSVGL
jgi:hypothetical protein